MVRGKRLLCKLQSEDVGRIRPLIQSREKLALVYGKYTLCFFVLFFRAETVSFGFIICGGRCHAHETLLLPLQHHSKEGGWPRSLGKFTLYQQWHLLLSHICSDTTSFFGRNSFIKMYIQYIHNDAGGGVV